MDRFLLKGMALVRIFVLPADKRQDLTIRVWHRSNGQQYRILSGHRGPVNAIQLQDGHVISASGDSLLK